MNDRIALLFAAGVLASCQHLRLDPVEPVLGVTPRLPGAVANAPRASAIDVQHYAIDIALDPVNRLVTGHCVVRFAAREQDLLRVVLDFAGLEVQGVRDSAGRSLAFRHQGEELAIDLHQVLARGAETELAIDYAGRPKKGLWFAGERAGVPTHAFTQGQCEDSRWWFPCWDAPSDFATSEITVTMPAGWTAVAAGERVGRSESGKTVTEHWRMDRPHAVYLTTLVAGEFLVREAMWEDVPLYYMAEPRYGKWMEASFDETPDMLGFLSELTGVRYPYTKYSQACVENFPFGGMENISATTLTSLTLNDERGNRDDTSHSLVAHEAAHQWFGNLVTCSDWSHVWLNESFATYAALLYFERTRGVDDFRIRMRDAQEKYIEADEKGRRPIVWSVYKDPIDLFGEHVYPGGAARLHLLRSILGDDLFVEGVRTYLAENAGQTVTTSDLQHAFEKVSGEKLGWFFDQWIHRPGFPVFETSWKWDQKAGIVTLDVVQTQLEGGGVPRAFKLPVDIEVRDRGGRATYRMWIDERRHAFEFPVAHEPIWVSFDKFGWVPKRLEAKRAPDEWLALAKEDDDVNGRRDAVRKLGELAQGTTDQGRLDVFRAELVDRLKKEPSPAVRAAAAEAAGRAGGLEVRTELRATAAGDTDAEVREQALLALRSFCPDAELARFAREQFDARYSWDVMGAAAGLLAAAEPDEAYAWLTRALLVEDSPHDQLRARLLRHLGALENASVSAQLRQWASDASADPSARCVAVEELGKRSTGRPEVAEFLAQMVHAEDNRLRVAALQALGRFQDPRTRRKLFDYYGTTVFPREKRIIEAALGTGP